MYFLPKTGTDVAKSTAVCRLRAEIVADIGGRVHITTFSHIFAFIGIFTDGRTNAAMATDASAEDVSLRSCHATMSL